jgi:hypothetical protein
VLLSRLIRLMGRVLSSFPVEMCTGLSLKKEYYTENVINIFYKKMSG